MSMKIYAAVVDGMVVDFLHVDTAETDATPGNGLPAAYADDVTNVPGIAYGWVKDASGTFSAPPATQAIVPVPTTITDRQFFQQLAVQGVISQAEALDAVRTGAIPAAMQALVDGLPAPQQFAAQMLISGATLFYRNSDLTAALAAAKGWSDAQVDALWTAAAAL